MRRRVATLVAGACVAGFAALGANAAELATAEDPSQTAMLSALNGSAVGQSFILVVDTPGATSAKLIIDGQFRGEDTQPPLEFPITVSAGVHKLKVRAVVGGQENRTDATFTATTTAPTTTGPDAGTTTSTSSDATSTTTTTSASTTSASTTTTTTTSTTTTSTTSTSTASTTTSTVPSTGNEVVVSSVDGIRSALATARPGDVIVVADGEYTFRPRLVASASGSAGAPITLRGSRAAVLRTKNSAGDYGLHVTGDHWRIEGITVAHASKGIVLDGSVGTVIDGVEVFDIGEEGVHFRACSSDGVLRNSHVHETGRRKPQYGEGVYVGSANSNWSLYQCTDAIEGQSTGDNSERVLIEDNLFEDTTAEGADLKEGTDSGTLRRNHFARTGLSGKQSADSAVDAKGNGWIIEDNVVSGADASWTDNGVTYPSKVTDAFQTHSVYGSYGTGNVFRRNRVIGPVPGFGFGLYPFRENVVTCDNEAPGAAKGVVGSHSQPASCNG